MQHPELSMRDRAIEMLADVIYGDAKITCTYTDLSLFPIDGPKAWDLEIRTTKGYRFTFYMEGINIAGVKEAIDTDGRRLVDRTRPLAILTGIPGSELATLEETVLTALSHAIPK